MGVIILVSSLLAISIGLNAVLFLKLKSQVKEYKLDAKDLIHDLTKRQKALVEIRVLDPEGLFFMKGGR